MSEKYTIPQDGMYMSRSSTIHMVPTGKFETVKNPNRLWFQFWKPKTITREIFEVTRDKSGQELRYFKSGEEVEASDFLYRLN